MTVDKLSDTTTLWTSRFEAMVFVFAWPLFIGSIMLIAVFSLRGMLDFRGLDLGAAIAAVAAGSVIRLLPRRPHPKIAPLRIYGSGIQMLFGAGATKSGDDAA